MLHDADSLTALRAAGPLPAELSVYGGTPWLGIDLAAMDGAPVDMAAWLPRLACPVVGVGPGTALAVACDVHLPDAHGLDALGERIAANPIAAASFVQLLRVSEGLPLAAGLLLESASYASLQAGEEYHRWLAAHRAEAPRPAADSGPAVLVEADGPSRRLTLNRPATQNAMSVEMRDALVTALATIADDAGVQRVEIRGRGDCFSTGGDLSEFGQVPDPASGHLIRMLSVPGKFLAMVAERAEAHVHGACIGSGIEFPAFAGTVTASPDAWFCLPEVGMGLIPGAGGCVSIARRIGRQRTARMGLTGEGVDAPTALAWGLVDRLI